MYPFIKSIHSNLAFVLLLVLLVVIIYALLGWTGRKSFTQTSKRFVLAGLIAAHLQLVIGLIVYFVSPLGVSNFSKETMGNSLSRLYALEHPLMMLIGITLITIGYSKAKRAAAPGAKYKLVTLFYTIGLVLILSRIPWQVWL